MPRPTAGRVGGVHAARKQSLVEPFALVFARTSPALYAQALAIVADAAVAEDLVQEAFLRIWPRRSRLQDPASLDGYLAAAVRNLALDHLRRNRRTQAKQLLVATPAAKRASEGPDAELIDDALRRLPPEQREVVLLRVHMELSFAEVAERTGTPLGTVHSRYRLAMTRLRAALSALAPREVSA